jgi:hypothetical protein
MRKLDSLRAAVEAVVIVLFVVEVVVGACIWQAVFYPPAAEAEVLTLPDSCLQR